MLDGRTLGVLLGTSYGLVFGTDEGIISFQLNLSRQFPAPCTVLQFFSNVHLSTIASFRFRIGVRVGVRVRARIRVRVGVRVGVGVGIQTPM